MRQYLAQAATAPPSAKALDDLLFRGVHEITRSLMHFSREQRAALLPSIIHLLLAAFLEELGTALRAQAGPGGALTT